MIVSVKQTIINEDLMEAMREYRECIESVEYYESLRPGIEIRAELRTRRLEYYKKLMADCVRDFIYIFDSLVRAGNSPYVDANGVIWDNPLTIL